MSEPSEELKRTVNGAGAAVDRTEQATERVLRLLRLVLYATGVLVLACAALLYLTQQLSHEVDDVRGQTGLTGEQVDHLEEFVEELEDMSPEEVAQSETTLRAVQLVPEILQVLCEVFPEATACQGG